MKRIKKSECYILNEQYKIVVASSLICGTILLYGCQDGKEIYSSASNNGVISEQNSEYSTKTSFESNNFESSSTENVNLIEPSETSLNDLTNATSENVVEEINIYSDIEWDSSVDGRMFAAYLKSQYDIDYVFFSAQYGFPRLLEQYLAEYYNSKKNTDYSYIPFSVINYDKAYQVSKLGDNFGIYYNESYKEYFSEDINMFFFGNMYFQVGVFDTPEVYLYNIMRNTSFDSIYPLEEVQSYTDMIPKNIDEDGIVGAKYINKCDSFGKDSGLFAYYLSKVNMLNSDLYSSFKIISLQNDGSQEYKDKVEFMNKMFHDHFLSKYGIDYEFHVDQPLDASFIDDVLIPAFGEDKVKEAQENLNRLQEEALAKQSEAPEKESQNVRSR